MIKNLKNKSVLHLWAITYIFLIFIPMICNLYMILRVNTAITKEVSDNTSYMLKNISTTLNNAFADMDTLRVTLGENATVIAMAERETTDTQTRYDAAVLCDTLNHLLTSYHFIDAFNMYFPTIDMMVSPEAFGESRLFYADSLNAETESYEAWKNRMDTLKYMKIVEENVSRSEETEQAVEFMIPVSRVGMDNSFVINIRVKKKTLFGEASEKLGGYSTVAVLSGNNDLLIQYGHPIDQLQFRYMNPEEEGKIFRLNLDGEMLNISYIRSNINGYRYVYLFSPTESAKRVKNVLVSIVLITLLSLGVMSIILYRLNKWNYGNIVNIMDGFGDYEEDLPETSNEFSIISARMANNKKKMNVLTDGMNKFKCAIKNGFLADYIKGYVTAEEAKRKFSEYGIRFEYDCFALVAVRIAEVGMSGRGTVGDAIFVVDNILRDCAGDDLAFTRIDTDGMLFYIVNAPSDVDIKAETCKTFSKVAEAARHYIGIHFQMVMSTVATETEKMQSLYQEVVLGMEYSDFYGVDSFLLYDDMKSETVVPDSYRFADETELLYYLREGETEKACALVDNLLSDWNDPKRFGRWQFNWMLYNILNTIMKSADNADTACVAELLQYAGKIENCGNVNEIKEFLDQLIDRRIQCNSHEKLKGKQICDKIKEYVHAHLTEETLCMTAIGEEMGLTPVYLSRVFKNYTGMKLNSYINERRIALAKEMILAEPDLKIEAISRRTGFYNTRTFLKVFKTTVGVTPSQFRKVGREQP